MWPYFSLMWWTIVRSRRTQPHDGGPIQSLCVLVLLSVRLKHIHTLSCWRSQPHSCSTLTRPQGGAAGGVVTGAPQEPVWGAPLGAAAGAPVVLSVAPEDVQRRTETSRPRAEAEETLRHPPLWFGLKREKMEEFMDFDVDMQEEAECVKLLLWSEKFTWDQIQLSCVISAESALCLTC